MSELYFNQGKDFHPEVLSPLFNWGQGVFSSFRLKEGQCLFQKEHKERLKMNYEKIFNEECSFDLKKEFEFIRQNKFSGKGRLCLFKDSQQKISSLLEVSELSEASALKVKSLKKETFNTHGVKLPFYALNFKFKNEVEKLGYDDYLNLDSEDYIKELSTSNLLAIDESGKVLICHHAENFMGIMITKLQEFLRESGQIVEVRKVSLSEVKKARALFATNSVQCLRFIHSLDDAHFLKDEFVINLERKILEFCEKSYGEE